MRLLSIDWDFFFPTKEDDPIEWPMWDWGHSEQWHQDFQSILWLQRYAVFATRGFPIPDLSGAEHSFWKNIKLSPRAEIFVAESHMYGIHGKVKKCINEVWNFDAHHDCGYHATTLKHAVDNMQFTCENWLAYYHMKRCKIFQVYPKWRNSAKEKILPQKLGINMPTYSDNMSLPIFNRVIIARSGSWVPPWLDDKFEAFLNTAPRDVVYLTPVTKRKFSAREASQYIAMEKKALVLAKDMQLAQKKNAPARSQGHNG
jgi:hypothetical protein